MTVIHEMQAMCRHCEWTATHTGKDLVKLAKRIRARLVGHVQQAHPERKAETVTWLIDDSADDASVS